MSSTLTQESQAEGQPGPFAALATLKIASFRYLLVGNAFAMLGFQARMMAQAWLVLEMTDSDAWVGAANGVPAIPVIFLTVFGGVLADRMNRRVMLVWSRLIFASLGLLTALMITAGVIELWHLFVLAFLVAVAQTFGITAGQTLIVDIVGRQKVFGANAVFGISFNTATFVGPAVGGLLIAEFGVDAAFYMIAVMLVISAVVVSFIRVAQPVRTGPPTTVMTDLKDGIGYVWATPALRWLLLLGFMLIFAGMYLPLMPRSARDVLEVGPGGFGVLLAAQGAGGLVGAASLILAGQVRSLARVLVIVNVGFLGLVILLAFSTSLALSSVATFGFGFLIVWWGNSMRTMFQLTATDEMRGRVMGIFSLIMQMLALSWLIGGLLSELIGPQATMIVGMVISVFFYLLAYARSPDLRRVGSLPEAA